MGPEFFGAFLCFTNIYNKIPAYEKQYQRKPSKNAKANQNA